MLYQIINPSDPYTIECPSLEIAVVACLMLGRGQYAFRPLDEGIEVPLFLFGVDAWFAEHLNGTIDEVVQRVIENKAEELATCLESCLIGGRSERRLYLAAVALVEPIQHTKLRDAWHAERCTSLNDIGGRAYAMAKRLRERAADPVVPAPQQVFTS